MNLHKSFHYLWSKLRNLAFCFLRKKLDRHSKKNIILQHDNFHISIKISNIISQSKHHISITSNRMWHRKQTCKAEDKRRTSSNLWAACAASNLSNLTERAERHLINKFFLNLYQQVFLHNKHVLDIFLTFPAHAVRRQVAAHSYWQMSSSGNHWSIVMLCGWENWIGYNSEIHKTTLILKSAKFSQSIGSSPLNFPSVDSLKATDWDCKDVMLNWGLVAYHNLILYDFDHLLLHSSL